MAGARRTFKMLSTREGGEVLRLRVFEKEVVKPHGDAARKDALCDALAEGERDKRRDSCFSSIRRGSRGESAPRRRPQSSRGNLLLLLAVACSTADAQWGALWSAKNMLCLHH